MQCASRGIEVDGALERLIDRLVFRGREQRPRAGAVVSREQIRHQLSSEMQGKRAGFASQAVAMALDILSAVVFYFAVLLVYGVVRFVVTDSSFEMPQPGTAVNVILVLAFGWFVLAGAWSASGRAPGMAVIGLRVVSADGDLLSPGRSRARAVLVRPDAGARRRHRAVQPTEQVALRHGLRVRRGLRLAPALPESRQNQ